MLQSLVSLPSYENRAISLFLGVTAGALWLEPMDRNESLSTVSRGLSGLEVLESLGDSKCLASYVATSLCADFIGNGLLDNVSLSCFLWWRLIFAGELGRRGEDCGLLARESEYCRSQEMVSVNGDCSDFVVDS